MTKHIKTGLGIALALMLTGPALAAGGDSTAAKPAPTADTVVATVNGTDITLGSMIALREQLPARYQQLPDKTLFDGILEQLEQQTMLAQTVEGHLTKAQKLALANARRAFLASTVLKQAQDAAVTDEAIQKAYDAKYANFTPTTEYHAAHILVKTEKEAKDIKAQLDKGADFATLAKKDSTDGSAAKGGDLGWFQADMMVKPFGDAVAKMKPGEVAGPIKTQFGWHLIKLFGTRPSKAPTLDSVRADLAADLQKQAVAAKLDALKADAKVTENTDGIDPSVLKDTKLLND
jgi:peptidyl-prolyl cis-trans isomerase C